MAKTQKTQKSHNIYTKCSKCDKELPVFNHTGSITAKFGRTVFNMDGEATRRVTDGLEIGGLCDSCFNIILPKIRSLFNEIRDVIDEFKKQKENQDGTE